MSSVGKEKLLEKMAQLKEEFMMSRCWIAGSVIETTRKQSSKRLPFFYLSQSVNGRTKSTYIPAAKLQIFKDAVIQGEKQKKVFAEICQINILLIKSGANNADE